MKNEREIWEIKNKLSEKEKYLKNHIYYTISSIMCEIFLFVLYSLFVLDSGNMFDKILSSIILGFFIGMIITHFFKSKKYLKEKRIIDKEYKLACETPEQTLARTRKEKFERILNVKN